MPQVRTDNADLWRLLPLSSYGIELESVSVRYKPAFNITYHTDIYGFILCNGFLMQSESLKVRVYGYKPIVLICSDSYHFQVTAQNLEVRP